MKPLMTFVVIHPNFYDIKTIQGTDLKDAVEAFKSSVWQQGWGADERVMREYGDWGFYKKLDERCLTYCGSLRGLSK